MENNIEDQIILNFIVDMETYSKALHLFDMIMVYNIQNNPGNEESYEKIAHIGKLNIFVEFLEKVLEYQNFLKTYDMFGIFEEKVEKILLDLENTELFPPSNEIVIKAKDIINKFKYEREGEGEI